MLAMSKISDDAEAKFWLDYLIGKLRTRWAEVQIYDQYYRGTHRALFQTTKYRETFGKLFSNFSDNWMAIIVDAVAERLGVQGFRFGGDEQADSTAWEIWQHNQMDSLSIMAHLEALVACESYATVWPDSNGYPEISIDHASQTIVEWDKGNRRKRLAALKVWSDTDGTQNATVYLPDMIFKYKREGFGPVYQQYLRSDAEAAVIQQQAATWLPRDTEDGAVVTNPYGVVPIVPLVSRPRLLTGGQSELYGMLHIQDAINKMVSDMIVQSEFSAFPQRWVSGLEVATDPETGEMREPFPNIGESKLLLAEKPDVHFGQFSATDLRNYVVGIEMLVQHLASQSRTPPHYFYLSGNLPSGESLRSAETGLIAKVRRQMLPFGEAWEEVMRICFKILGDTKKAQIVSAETIWADPEYRSESEHVDAVMKMQALGVPNQELWAQLEFSPQKIARLRRMNTQLTLGDQLAAMRVPAISDEPVGAS